MVSNKQEDKRVVVEATNNIIGAFKMFFGIKDDRVVVDVDSSVLKFKNGSFHEGLTARKGRKIASSIRFNESDVEKIAKEENKENVLHFLSIGDNCGALTLHEGEEGAIEAYYSLRDEISSNRARAWVKKRLEDEKEYEKAVFLEFSRERIGKHRYAENSAFQAILNELTIKKLDYLCRIAEVVEKDSWKTSYKISKKDFMDFLDEKKLPSRRELKLAELQRIINKGTSDKVISALLDMNEASLHNLRGASRSNAYWILKSIPEKKLREYAKKGDELRSEFELVKNSPQ